MHLACVIAHNSGDEDEVARLPVLPDAAFLLQPALLLDEFWGIDRVRSADSATGLRELGGRRARGDRRVRWLLLLLHDC